VCIPIGEHECQVRGACPAKARSSSSFFFFFFSTAIFTATDALREVLKERGVSATWSLFFRISLCLKVAGLFAGLTPSLVLSIYPALQHAIFDKLKREKRKQKKDGECPNLIFVCFQFEELLSSLAQ